MNEGKKQRYGSQFTAIDAEKEIVTLAPIENFEELDQRRREVGMMPIEMYKRMILKHY